LSPTALPEASGPTSGTVAGDPTRPLVRLAVLGESTAAGVGVETHEEGFAGSLARELTDRTGRPVAWEVVGQDAATARRIRHRLLPRLGRDLNVAVLLAGVNDVVGQRTPDEWGDDLGAIVDGLVDRAEQVAVAGLPPFAAIPSLPTDLGRALSDAADILDEVSQRVCDEQPRATFVSSKTIVAGGPEFFALDGYHPSATGYRVWAQAVAERLAL
jgi:lysophospholipase L1-like esterase